jgi:ParB family chromosome partitioning protein
MASIPIESIQVLNPRTRNRRQHREIVDNIDTVGLKRPVTVRRRQGEDGDTFDLICGEGRLEAFRMLGAEEIPAIVIDADDDDCLVMSLVENIARRQHRPIDIMHEIGSLRRRGYNDAQIAEKIGCTPSWANMVESCWNAGKSACLQPSRPGSFP